MSRACHHEGPILSLLSLERGTERKTEIVMVERDRQRQADRKKKQEETERGVETKAVSYTHLTLPTKLSV